MGQSIGIFFASLFALFEPSFEAPAKADLSSPELTKIVLTQPELTQPELTQSDLQAHRIVLSKEVSACDKYDREFYAAAQKYSPLGHKEEFSRWLKAQAFAESSCRPDVCSPAGACGLMAFLEGTAKDMGVEDRFDPRQSIRGGAKYMNWLYGQWRAHDRTPVQRQELALGCYNWGLGNFLDLQRKYGCINFDCFQDYVPEETETYVARISGLVK